MSNDEHEPQDPEAQKLARRREALDAYLHGYQVPVVNTGVSWASGRLAVCDVIKKLERSSKSPIIDSFTRNGLPLGAHRAGDALHDPICGFFLASKQMGFKQACEKWFPHMASDVMTKRSLPLPFTYLCSNDSWIVRMYAKGLVNLRSAVISPVIGVALTDCTVRARLRSDETTDKDLVLEREHLNAAMIAALCGLALWAIPQMAPEVVVAFLATALWSLIAACGYSLKRQREAIILVLRRAKAATVQQAKRLGAGIREALPSKEVEPLIALESDADAQVAKPTASGMVMGIAAVVMVFALMRGPSPSSGT